MSEKDIHILVVEDEDDHAELIRCAFASRAGKVSLTVARNLREARAYLAESVPTLIIADLLLPDGKGTELLPTDREKSPYPVMVMTGHGDEQAAVRAMKAGVLDYVVKSESTLANMPYFADRALRQWGHIIERRRAERKAIAAYEKLRCLASELCIVEERERRRLAAVVHDNIGQNLALAKLTLQSSMELVSDSDVSASLEKVCEVIDKAIQDAHSLTFELSNPVLYELGFEAAVEAWLVEQVQEKYGLKYKFIVDKQSPKLDNEISVILFQAVRELLVNVVKHAEAETVTVCIQEAGNRVKVTVEDDGVGFLPAKLQLPLSQNKTGGFGLFNIQERLEYLGGELKIESAPGKGTCITLISPPKRQSKTLNVRES